MRDLCRLQVFASDVRSGVGVQTFGCVRCGCSGVEKNKAKVRGDGPIVLKQM